LSIVDATQDFLARRSSSLTQSTTGAHLHHRPQTLVYTNRFFFLVPHFSGQVEPSDIKSSVSELFS